MVLDRIPRHSANRRRCSVPPGGEPRRSEIAMKLFSLGTTMCKDLLTRLSSVMTKSPSCAWGATMILSVPSLWMVIDGASTILACTMWSTGYQKRRMWTAERVCTNQVTSIGKLVFFRILCCRLWARVCHMNIRNIPGHHFSRLHLEWGRRDVEPRLFPQPQPLM